MEVFYDWEKRRVQAFDALPGHIRASFAGPVPGTHTGDYDAMLKWPDDAPTTLEAKGSEGMELVEKALKNFAMVVLDPIEVDVTELNVLPKPDRRTIWKKSKGDIWEKEIVVP